jgi:hypothetical protein
MYKKVKTAGKYFSIFHSKALKTFAQIGIFRFENKPSGNPGIWQSLVLSCLVLLFQPERRPQQQQQKKMPLINSSFSTKFPPQMGKNSPISCIPHCVL